jgi:hypothetical protein
MLDVGEVPEGPNDRQQCAIDFSQRRDEIVGSGADAVLIQQGPRGSTL